MQAVVGAECAWMRCRLNAINIKAEFKLILRVCQHRATCSLHLWSCLRFKAVLFGWSWGGVEECRAAASATCGDPLACVQQGDIGLPCFCPASRPALVSTWSSFRRWSRDCSVDMAGHPRNQELMRSGDISPGVKWPGHETNHSLPPMVGSWSAGLLLAIGTMGGVMTLTRLYKSA
jgi:hypothetical protein